MTVRKQWKVTVALDDGTNTWVSVEPVESIHDVNGERPYVERAAAGAAASFIRNVTRDENELRRRWLA